MSELKQKNDTADIIQIGKEVLNVEIEGLTIVSKRLGVSFADAVNLLASCEGRVAVTGLGKSGLIGRKIAATLSSTGTPAYFMHPVEGAHGDLGSILERDIVIAISNSGKTAELLAIINPIRQIGARIIALVGAPSSPLGDLADLVIDLSISKEACALNLAPTASSTVALAVGDALAVCLSKIKDFTEDDFKRFHPGGFLGQRLKMRAAELMRTEDLPIASDDSSVGEAISVLDRGNMGAVILVDGSKRLVGIITDGDLRRQVARESFNAFSPVSSLMTHNPRRGEANDSVANLLDIMEGKSITVLPITDSENRLVGLLHLHDLLGKGQFRFSG